MDVLHQQEDVVLIMKSLDKTNNVRENSLFQDLLFLKYTHLHLFFLYLLLREAFDCIKIGSVLNILNKKDLSELSFS